MLGPSTITSYFFSTNNTKSKINLISRFTVTFCAPFPRFSVLLSKLALSSIFGGGAEVSEMGFLISTTIVVIPNWSGSRREVHV